MHNRCWRQLGSILAPNLGPKMHQNRRKIDAKMPSDVDLLFWSIFDRSWLLTSTPRTSKIEPPLQREHDFSKNRFSMLCTFLSPFGCQLASILPPKIHKKSLPKSIPKGIDFLIHFGIDFFTVLPPSWSSSGWVFRAPWGPPALESGFMGFLMRNLRHENPKFCFKHPWNRFCMDFWTIFVSCLADF